MDREREIKQVTLELLLQTECVFETFECPISECAFFHFLLNFFGKVTLSQPGNGS